ncbi:MAG: multicopper oxidase type 3, partial [Gammaproteobacteria bacterium]|nr:multicopper oxidase type 3 [Gammaproteobacteria bacterium]
VKEEDKNILIGDSWIAPFANTQFMGVGNIFIVPDQATLNDANVLGGNLRRAFPPCVGPIHRVPDYLSLFPDSSQVAPFAGQDRPLCDHKEVVLADQMQTSADFQLFTQAPIAGHITGIMLNDAAAEFDPYNPAFLEKASLPNAPISIKNYNGTEIARVYNDRYGTFNNLVPSSWQANVPDPSGFGANMLTYCMNDPGPIPDPSGQIDPSTITAANPNGSVRMITDPMYNPIFSNFCYNWPTLAGITTYLDTPVLPVSAYASASTYEPVDCAYPNNTPAIFRVDGTEIGPFIDSHNATRTLTITALGDVQVLNPAYEGPNAAPTAAAPTINQPKIKRHYGFGAAPGSVTIGGVSVPVTAAGWSDGKITLTVPATGVATGQLVVTTANGQQTIDSITVTIDDSTRRGYRAPVHVSPAVAGTSSDTGLAHPIQDAIDAANAGDLIILDSGNYPELVIMDRPVRLQGVGAAAVVINATKFPNQKVDQWRTRINNLFGLDNQGNALPGTAGTYPPVDPLPGQEITGGVVLLEPSVLSTEEGAGITVLAKGYKRNGQPLGTSRTDCANVGNFLCAASRIDGVSVTGGDAGGGIYVNGWAHNLEISNNRVYGNAGPFAGGVRIGQPYLEGQTLPAEDSFDGFGYDLNVKIHNNAITNNGTVEGNAAAGAPAAAAGGAGGGLSICAGSDGYKVTGNWICGNFTSSDGGGIGHIGLSQNGLIQNNKILFNESYNQTGPQSGGGLIIEGEGATGTTLTLGSGNVRVDSNLILGNFARAGSGGGIRLQSVNGADAATEGQRWKVTVTNNMIVNNLAAWAGAGVSLADTLFSSVVNNTIASNDSTGIAGNLFNTQVGTLNTGSTTAVPNPAGISSELTSAPLLARLPSRLRTANTISDPHLVNDIVWHNRSFFFTMASGSALLSPSNKWTDAVATTKPALGAPAANGCTGTDAYWDVGVVGDTSAATPSIPGFAVGNTVLSTTVGTPNITQPYCNASRTLPGRQFEPGTPFQPPFGINVSATLDESGNFVDLHFGPLSLMDQATGTAINGDYHLAGQSGNAYNSGVVPPASASLAVAHDFDGDPRPQALIYDIGADEFLVPSPKASVSANSLGFGSVLLNASKTLTFTLSNKGTAALTIGSIALSGPRAASYTSTNDCAGAVAINGSCTITVNFTPTALGAAAATLTITDNDPLTSPTLIGLSGTGIAGFTLSPQSPPTVNFGQVRIGNRATFDINVTNNTAASLTNLKASYGTPGASADFASMPAGTTCGTTLLAGASCRFAVAFTPKTGQSGSTQNVTMTVSGVQGSTAVSLTDALVGTVK